MLATTSRKTAEPKPIIGSSGRGRVSLAGACADAAREEYLAVVIHGTDQFSGQTSRAQGIQYLVFFVR